ncbi:unnamed protein product [Hymenolepis diminuta]|uniref:Uncharacterized protein n=1 Tax=Hymenolepis diminuta TaxID=6216 RepID=A0A564Y6J1_HYMDI|nr:unnamed protein product [Hymenolepis diminuta]
MPSISPLFSITSSLHLKSTSALMFSRDLTQVTHIKLSLFPTQKQLTHISHHLQHLLLISSFPQRSPLPLSPTRFNPYRGFLYYIFGLLNTWCSASQLLLALKRLRIVDCYCHCYLLTANH